MRLGPFSWGLTQLPGQDTPKRACLLPAAITLLPHLPQGLPPGFPLVFLALEWVLEFLALEWVLVFLALESGSEFLDLGQRQVRGLLGAEEQCPPSPKEAGLSPQPVLQHPCTEARDKCSVRSP